MYINVKMIDEDGKPKGRAYTYECDFDITAGELVYAEFGNAKRALIVDEIDTTPNFDISKIKTVERIAEIDDVVAEEQDAIQIKVLVENPAKIEINFDEIKEALTATLELYKGMVVTSSTLPTAKRKAKELAGLRNKIDTYRKDKKKELSRPIEKFEGQCKELITFIEEAEKPVKESIEVFDDAKRTAKREMAEKLIKEVIASEGLRPEFAEKLTVTDKYCNLTASESDVKNDLEHRAEALRVEQNSKDELMNIVLDTVEAESKKLKRPLDVSQFLKFINAGLPTSIVLQNIKEVAESQFLAENPPKIEGIKEVETMVIQQEIVPEIEKFKEIEMCYAEYTITATLEDLRRVSAFLKENNISYIVGAQGTIK